MPGGVISRLDSIHPRLGWLCVPICSGCCEDAGMGSHAEIITPISAGKTRGANSFILRRFMSPTPALQDELAECLGAGRSDIAVRLGGATGHRCPTAFSHVVGLLPTDLDFFQ